MRVLLLSAYAAGSHVHWRDSLRAMFPDWEWQILELPPRHFSWRVRGNPLSWAISERATLEAGYDLLIATSMVDLATLRGLVPVLGTIPAALYFHENQFAYPANVRQRSLLEAQMVSLYSALAADRLLFNSHFNRSSFFAGLTELLDKLPDHVPRGVVGLLESRSTILPVPIFPRCTEFPDGPVFYSGTGRYPQRPLRLLWTGRFEHDRGPESLLEALRLLEGAKLDYQVAIVGQQFRHSPDAFGQIAREFAPRLVHFGYLPDRAQFLSLLEQADIIVSTTRHEFQGLAVLEAVQQECIPLLPDRLSYPELFDAQYLYPSYPQDAVMEASALVAGIHRLARGMADGELSAPDVSRYGLTSLASQYSQEFLQLASASSRTP